MWVAEKANYQLLDLDIDIIVWTHMVLYGHKWSRMDSFSPDLSVESLLVLYYRNWSCMI